MLVLELFEREDFKVARRCPLLDVGELDNTGGEEGGSTNADVA